MTSSILQNFFLATLLLGNVYCAPVENNEDENQSSLSSLENQEQSAIQNAPLVGHRFSPFQPWEGFQFTIPDIDYGFPEVSPIIAGNVAAAEAEEEDDNEEEAKDYSDNEEEKEEAEDDSDNEEEDDDDGEETPNQSSNSVVTKRSFEELEEKEINEQVFKSPKEEVNPAAAWIRDQENDKLFEFLEDHLDSSDSKIVENVIRFAVHHYNEPVLEHLLNELPNERFDILRKIVKFAAQYDCGSAVTFAIIKGFSFEGRQSLFKIIITYDAINVAEIAIASIENFREFEENSIMLEDPFLHDAKSAEMIKILLNAGADAEATNAHGKTAVQEFVRRKSFSLVKAFPLESRVHILCEAAKIPCFGIEFAMDVHRQNILMSSYAIASTLDTDWYEVDFDLAIKFATEDSEPGDGPYREWLSLLIESFFSPPKESLINEATASQTTTNGPLFVPVNQETNRYAPNVQINDLELFRFAGSIVALTLKKNIPLGIEFIPFIQRMLFDQSVTFDDLLLHEPQLYHSLEKMREPDYDFETMPMYFEDDQDRQVTAENVQEFLDQKAWNVMAAPYLDRVYAFHDGFLTKSNKIKLENYVFVAEFASILKGQVKVSADEFLDNINFEWDVTQDLLEYFEQYIRECTDQQRIDLIRFITGSHVLPFDGMKSLSPQITIQKTVYGEANTDKLPRASTCYNYLYLAPVDNYEQFKERLTKAVEFCDSIELR